MRNGALWLALLASSTRAQDAEVDPSLPSYRPVAGVAGVLEGHASAGTSDFMTLWGAGFERIYPSVRVELDDEGFESADAGAATFGPYLGAMGEHTTGRFKSRFGYAAMEIPVCLCVLGVFVQKDNPYEGGLPIEQVETILSSGFWNVTWGDLGCGGKWAQRPINLYARRGTHSVLRPYARFPFSFKESVKEYSDDAAVVASVMSDAGGLGLASIGCRTEKVRVLAIAPKGGSEFVPATADNARNGSYPLTDTFYLVLNHDPQGGFDLDPLRREFLRYILSKDGQQGVVKAGHVALSAEQAEQALAQFGLLPTGEGLWDRMMLRLHARRLPGMQMTSILGVVRRVGDRPTHEQLVGLSNRLANTRLTSSVAFATDEEGATIKCCLVGQPKALFTVDQTKGAEATVPIGLYNVWTERDGKPTSPRDAWFQVIREHERIKVYENSLDPEQANGREGPSGGAR